MKSKAPNQAGATAQGELHRGDRQKTGLAAGFLSWVQQGLCGLHGHDSLLQYERNRIFLRCTSCGYETRGWDLSRSRRPAGVRAEAHASPLPASDLVVMRKTA